MAAKTFVFIAATLGCLAFFSMRNLRVESRDARFETIGERRFLGAHPFSGILVERYDDGQLYRELRYRGGRLEGESREYNFGEKLRAIFHYRNGVKHGLQTTWFAEGPKKLEENLVDGVLDGEVKEWHLNGELFRHFTYANGIETARKIFFANTNIYSNYVTNEGRNYGIDGGALCMETKPDGAR